MSGGQRAGVIAEEAAELIIAALRRSDWRAAREVTGDRALLEGALQIVGDYDCDLITAFAADVILDEPGPAAAGRPAPGGVAHMTQAGASNTVAGIATARKARDDACTVRANAARSPASAASS
jgi:hypothetical protein